MYSFFFNNASSSIKTSSRPHQSVDLQGTKNNQLLSLEAQHSPTTNLQIEQHTTDTDNACETKTLRLSCLSANCELRMHIHEFTSCWFQHFRKYGWFARLQVCVYCAARSRSTMIAQCSPCKTALHFTLVTVRVHDQIHSLLHSLIQTDTGPCSY